MPPPRIELRLSVYKTNILPLYYRGSEDIFCISSIIYYRVFKLIILIKYIKTVLKS